MRWNWRQNRWLTAVIGLVVGAAAGFAVYEGSTLSGRNLFILCGTTAGIVAAIVINGYANRLDLTEVTLTIPQFSELKFAVTKDNAPVAWRLFVESVTRISVQRLDDGTGLVREALTSLYVLFTTTREVLTQTRPSRRTGSYPTVEHLAIAMLNNELRPFMSKWHPLLHAWEQANAGRPESEWPANVDCRTELEAMRLRLLRYVAGYGELAGVPNVGDMMNGSLDADFGAPAQVRRSARTS